MAGGLPAAQAVKARAPLVLAADEVRDANIPVRPPTQDVG